MGICTSSVSGESGSEFARPSKYTTHLSGLIYCTRLILLRVYYPVLPTNTFNCRHLDVASWSFCRGFEKRKCVMVVYRPYRKSMHKTSNRNFHLTSTRHWSNPCNPPVPPNHIAHSFLLDPPASRKLVVLVHLGF